MVAILDNPNPTIFKAKKDSLRDPATSLWGPIHDDEYSGSGRIDDSAEPEPIDADEIYGMLCALYPSVDFHITLLLYLDLIRSISDPEHPTTTLEQLGVVSADQVTVDGDRVIVQFTPTVPHCGSATLIGELR